MHPFPPIDELQFLIGKELGQVCLGSHQVQLRWWDGGQINVEGELEHMDDDGRVHRYDCAAAAWPPLLLHRLLHKKVIMLDVEPLCLSLIFDDGQKLRLRSEEGPFECGQIMVSDDFSDGYIVF